ncbi:MAG: LON peptidase substrate-binding domain-containing protein [Planctomycetota bacterium]|nr:LON peptidase substrate-binding domain-containing protein [Planctomycetota bacterium]
MQGTPLDTDAILRSFDGEVRLFPLPNLVLFPDAFAPLKVFEDRYVRLVEDAIEGDGLVALALLKAGWEEDYVGAPEIHPTVCVGKILRQRRLSSGKFDVLLYGLFRARILEELGAYPYRRARVEIVEDQIPATQLDRIARRVRRALDLVPGRKGVISEMRRMANQLRGVDAGAGRYADAVANASDLLPDARYELLSEPDVLRRLDRLIGLLEARAYEGAPPAPRGTRPELN